MKTLSRLTLLALLSALVATSAFSATVLTPNSGWQPFYWDTETTPVFDPGDGYTLTVTQKTLLQVLDLYLPGDEFTVTVNGDAYDSTDVSVGPGSSVGDPSVAWKNVNFSKLALWLSPGSYSIQLSLKQSALDEEGAVCTGGAGVIQATSTPEPGSLTLIGLGLAFVGFVVRRRSHSAA